MARKAHNIHYIYKTTCNVTGKYYVGMHSTCNLNDGYMGSGKRLRYSIRKYGEENHSKEILSYHGTREELVLREIEIITKELIAEPMCMNLMCGGQGGFVSDDAQKKRSLSANAKLNEKLKTDPEFKDKFLKNLKKGVLKSYQNGRVLNLKDYDWNGKSHSDETKQLMSEQRQGQGSGEANSQYGTCWVTKDSISKKIKKENLEQYLLDAWSKGRK